ncbi:MAG TPA: DUF2950 domain-containing protein [Burkholderiales bacterium]|nr:DUF2950 domain-containing protein [Burkholderiales bacterium]
MKSAIAVSLTELMRGVLMAVLVSALIAVGVGNEVASAADQKAFVTPEEAARALVAALTRNNMQLAAAILGPDGEKLLHSGDPVADRKARQRFLTAYAKQHRLAYEAGEKAVLRVGEEDWPLPIPIVRNNGTWRFDSAAGVEEILNRRIGRNELNAIQVCLAILDAQREYAATDHDGSGVRGFARRLVSASGAKDGLYWPTKNAEEPSPLGPLVARAVEEGYPTPAADGKPVPYHGYFYKILTAQGEHAKGGAYDYLVDGRMVGGFALVAYPARYGVSGIMTFIVNHDGTVYQNDLGGDTSQLARSMTQFDPDSSWSRVESAAQPSS